jgi:hypothetical protein
MRHKRRELAARFGGILVGVMLVLALCACTAGSSSAEPMTSSPAPSSEPSVPEPTPISTPLPPAGWTDVEIPGIDWLGWIAERDGRLVAVGNTANEQLTAAMAFSDDGEVWTAINISTFDGFWSVFSGDPGFGAIAARYVPGELPAPTYLFSADGETWETALPPANCGIGRPVFGQFGFVALGATCSVGQEGAPPGPLYILTSADGRAWTSRLDEDRIAGGWFTNGSRLVLFGESLAPISEWVSDDLAQTWRYVDTPFPANVSVNEVKWGHDRYLAAASWLIREGDPDSAACVSEDGETWNCEVIAASGDMATRDYLGVVAVTPTGYVSLGHYPNDLFVPSGYTMVIGTSTDGLQWTFDLLPDMADRIPYGLASTSHGLFTWGGTAPETDSSGRSQPYIQVSRAPLP